MRGEGEGVADVFGLKLGGNGSNAVYRRDGGDSVPDNQGCDGVGDYPTRIEKAEIEGASLHQLRGIAQQVQLVNLARRDSLRRRATCA